MRILEEFWYGNIEPTNYDTSSCKEYKKLQELICRNEEKLQVAMTDERTESIVREIHGLCPRTSNNYGVSDIPEQL